MSKKRPNKGKQREKLPTSPENHLASAQPASREVQQGTLKGAVCVSHSKVFEGTRPSHEQIAARAYHLWETYGRRAGTDRDDWFQAERLLLAESS
jgi:hypothetical protein